MRQHQQRATPVIYALADHLDAVLAAAEDLLKLDPVKPEPSNLLRLELVAITHVFQARQRLRDFHFLDQFLADQSKLFVASTDALSLEFLAEATVNKSHLSADYLIGHRVPIRVLADLSSTMLDALEFELRAV